MTRMISLLVVIISCALSINALMGLDCAIPARALEAFKNLLAWNVFWYGEEYLNTPQLELNVVQRDDQAFWYLISSKTLFYQDYATEVSNWYSMRTCPEITWIQCMKEDVHSRPIPAEKTDFSAWILGMPSPSLSKQDPLQLKEACHIFIRSDSIGSWYPSPNSILKTNAVKAVTEEIKRQAGFFGTPNTAICNDFNLDDPMVFSLVDITDLEGKASKIFITIKFNGRSAMCATKHIDTRVFPEKIVQKVSERPIHLEMDIPRP